MRPCLGRYAVLLAALLPLAASIANGQTLETSSDCINKSIEIQNTGSSSPVNVNVYFVLASYPIADPGCSLNASNNVVQIVERKELGLVQNTPRTFTFAELGINLPVGCDVYIATLRATVSGTTDASESHCKLPEVFPLPTVDRASVLSAITADLGLTNVIDLAAVGGGTCVGGREYLAQACNKSLADAYRVTGNARYRCGQPGPCFSEPNPGGDGWNQAVQTAD